jgi:hypothetical protein
MKMQRIVGTLGMIGLAFGGTSCLSDEADGQALPATCKDVKGITGGTADGVQTLFLEHDPAMSWPAYCADMNTASPTEYLDLPSTSALGEVTNYAQYIEYKDVEGKQVGFLVKTRYDRVRIDPSTLAVDITDIRFATSDSTSLQDTVVPPVSVVFKDTTITHVPFGVAMQCGEPREGSSRAATANVSLYDLPFQIAIAQVCAHPTLGSYEADADEEPSRIDVTAKGGYARASTVCARSSIECLPDPAINGLVRGGKTIQLRYVEK